MRDANYCEPPEFFLPDYTEAVFKVMCEADENPNHWLRDAITKKFGSCPQYITDATDEDEELNQFVEEIIIKDLTQDD